MVQKPITVYDRYGLPHTYRVDAYIEHNGRKLVIEFDGGVHNMKSNKDSDYVRDCNLKDAGYLVLRLNQNELLEELMCLTTYVKDRILTKLGYKNKT